MSYNWLAGAGLSVVGSVCSNLGVNIQKFSINTNEALPKEQQVGYTKQKLWVFGLVLVIVGSLGDFAALGLAAQSVVAPIGSFTLVANILFARYGLKETLVNSDIYGTIMIIVGAVVAVAFGNHEESDVTLDQLGALYWQLGFLAYAVVVILTLFLLYSFVKKLEPLKEKLVDAIQLYEKVCKEIGAQSSQAVKIDLQIAMYEKAYSKYEKVHPFCYCAISGIFGGQSILFGKMTAELIATSIGGNNQMLNIETWIFVAAMLCTIFTQIHFLALALKYFDALYVVPVFQCFFITVSTLGGAAYFKEFSTFKTHQAIMFPMGLSLTLFGVYILSARDMSSHRDDMGAPAESDESGDFFKKKRASEIHFNDGGSSSQSFQNLQGVGTGGKTLALSGNDALKSPTSQSHLINHGRASDDEAASPNVDRRDLYRTGASSPQFRSTSSLFDDHASMQKGSFSNNDLVEPLGNGKDAHPANGHTIVIHPPGDSGAHTGVLSKLKARLKHFGLRTFSADERGSASDGGNAGRQSGSRTPRSPSSPLRSDAHSMWGFLPSGERLDLSSVSAQLQAHEMGRTFSQYASGQSGPVFVPDAGSGESTTHDTWLMRSKVFGPVYATTKPRASGPAASLRRRKTGLDGNDGD